MKKTYNKMMEEVMDIQKETQIKLCEEERLKYIKNLKKQMDASGLNCCIGCGMTIESFNVFYNVWTTKPKN